MNTTLEVGIRLAPTKETLTDAARSLANLISEEMPVPVRLAGVDMDDTHVLLTMAVAVGSVDDVKTNSGVTPAAVVLIDKVLAGLTRFDAHFAAIPDPADPAARFADALLERRDGFVDVALDDLAAAA